MRAKLVKMVSAVVCISIMLCAVLLSQTVIHGTRNAPILYYNDRSWSLSSRFPAEKDDNGVYYIPLTVFVQLPDVEVRINKTLQTFIITHGDYYLSFDTATGYAANQDKERMPLSTYERQGERYVPAEVACAQLKLGYEKITSPITGEDAIRVTDGHEQYSFITLLRRYEHNFYAESTTPGIIPVPETEPTDETARPTLTERVIYITIEDSPGAYTENILHVLSQFGVKATFFVVGDRASQNIELLSKIVAGGHAVALHTMSHNNELLTDADAILTDIEEENALLSRTVKLKSRIWRAPEGSSELPALTDEVKAAISDNGYVIWDANINVPSGRSSTASQYAINGIWGNKTSVLRFCENQYTAETLRTVLNYIKKNSEGCELRVISPAFNPED